MSNYLDFSVKTRDQMKDWIMKKLGYPLIQVEITEDQLDLCINDSVEEFTKYVRQESKYLELDLETYNLSGFTLPNNVVSVFALEEGNMGGQSGGVGELFSMKNTLANAGYFPNIITAGGGSGAWITYELAMQYMDMMKRLTANHFDFEYNERTKLLSLTPIPDKISAKGHIVVGVYTIRPDDLQFGESWVKRFSLALAKQIIGNIRSKFANTALLGGAQIDVALKTEGLTEQDNLLAELKETYSFLNFFVG